MGHVYADIELINMDDVALVRRKIIGEDEVKSMRVKMLVDSGSVIPAINENIQEYLQFPYIETRKAQLANGDIIECAIVGPVELRFKNRNSSCKAIVLPGDSEPLLSAIPLEEMDVIIHPTQNELIVHPDHPYFAQIRL